MQLLKDALLNNLSIDFLHSFRPRFGFWECWILIIFELYLRKRVAIQIQILNFFVTCKLILVNVEGKPEGGGTQLWVTRHVPPKKNPTFFRLFSPKDPHFYHVSPNDRLFLTNSLSPKDPDTNLSLKDPSFSHLIVKQVSIFGKKFDFSKISTKLMKCWEIFGHFGPESPYFFMYFTERPPIFVRLVTERPHFLT